MKKVIIFLFCILPIISFGQSIPQRGNGSMTFPDSVFINKLATFKGALNIILSPAGYTGNLGSLFADHSLPDIHWVDSVFFTSQIPVPAITYSYIKYFDMANWRNTEGDVTVSGFGWLYSHYSQFRNATNDSATVDIGGKLSIDGGKTWQEQYMNGITIYNIATEGLESISMVPSVTFDTIQMYFIRKNTHIDSKVYRSTSFDSATSWSAPTQIISDTGYQIIKNGAARKIGTRLFLPIAWVADSWLDTAFSCYDWYSDDNGATWTKSNVISTTMSLDEPSIFPSGSNLIMRMRTAAGVQYFSTSTNNGATWNAPVASNLVSSNSPAEIAVLPNTKLLAIYNPPGQTNTRYTLQAAESSDGGTTWTNIFILDGGLNSNFNYSYPSISFDKTKTHVLVSYWETNYAAGKLALKFASIPTSIL